MARVSTKKYSQSRLFEFRPSNNVSADHVMELMSLIRVGVSGEILDKASPELKKHFVEVAK